MTAYSFDGTELCEASTERPERRQAVEQLLAGRDPISIWGGGLSYALASAAPGAITVDVRRFNRIISIDEDQETVRVETGITMGDLIQFLAARGFWFPILPGHPAITLGGCIAFNTHGKTQHDIGQMSDHVMSLRLVHPRHGELECSPSLEPDLFNLTVGGMGLTGWILDAELTIERLPASSIVRRSHPVANFVESVAVMESDDVAGSHLYSWNDANARNGRFGQGIVYDESFSDQGSTSATTKYRPLRARSRGRLVPVPLWNRGTVTIANATWNKLERRRDAMTLDVLDAAFPINGREGYFHLFGRRGFREYQLIVPRATWNETVTRIQRLISTTGACVTLSSLKRFSGERRLLWFRGEGICLTLDGPANAKLASLFHSLDKLAIELQAPVNIAKDSRLDAQTVASIFPEYEEFRSRLRSFDPERRFDSQLRRRINV